MSTHPEAPHALRVAVWVENWLKDDEAYRGDRNAQGGTDAPMRAGGMGGMRGGTAEQPATECDVHCSSNHYKQQQPQRATAAATESTTAAAAAAAAAPLERRKKIAVTTAPGRTIVPALDEFARQEKPLLVLVSAHRH
jgi:hypothetical protein